MPSLDQPAERPSAEVAARRFPTDAALDVHGQQQRFKRIVAVLRNRREELAAMVLELQANRAILDGMANWYGVFIFTGGRVPTAQWNLVAMTCLERALAADRLFASAIQRYRHLAQAISELGQAKAGPRTLRCRHELGAEFGQAASEIRALGDTLEAAVRKAMEELRPPSPLTEKRSAWESAE